MSRQQPPVSHPFSIAPQQPESNMIWISVGSIAKPSIRTIFLGGWSIFQKKDSHQTNNRGSKAVAPTFSHYSNSDKKKSKNQHDIVLVFCCFYTTIKLFTMELRLSVRLRLNVGLRSKLPVVAHIPHSDM